jgi:hypothetical protein
VVTFLLFFLLVSLVVFTAAKLYASNLKCSDLTNCTGKASCGESGTHLGCSLSCKGGAEIDCPDVE